MSITRSSSWTSCEPRLRSGIGGWLGLPWVYVLSVRNFSHGGPSKIFSIWLQIGPLAHFSCVHKSAFFLNARRGRDGA
jgi:hypothetical protein